MVFTAPIERFGAAGADLSDVLWKWMSSVFEVKTELCIKMCL